MTRDEIATMGWDEFTIKGGRIEGGEEQFKKIKSRTSRAFLNAQQNKQRAMAKKKAKRRKKNRMK